MRNTVTADDVKSYIKQAGGTDCELYSETDIEKWIADSETEALLMDPNLTDSELNVVVLDLAVSCGLLLLDHPQASAKKEHAKEKIALIQNNRWTQSSSSNTGTPVDDNDPPMIRTRGRVSQSSLRDSNDWNQDFKRHNPEYDET